MFRKIMSFLFEALAVKQYLLFSASFFALSGFIMIATDNLVRPAGCPGIIPLELSFTKTAFNNIVSACGATGVRSHIILIWIDYIFIFAYTGFLANLLGSLVRGIERGHAIAIFSLPVLAGFLDIIENTLILTQLSSPENLSGIVIFTASTAALLKFLLLAASIGLIIYYLFHAAKGKR
ncbi:MAG: hypothetical protein RIG61_05845 [Deltaproteobacteria bacterium]